MTIYTTYLERLTDIDPEKKSLQSVIDSIKNGEFENQVNAIQQEPDDKEQSKLKLKLPAFKPSVLTDSIGLTDEAIATGLIQLELDVKDNLELDIEPIKQKLIAIPEIVYCFLSPRKGLKFAINSNFTNNDIENGKSTPEPLVKSILSQLIC